MFQPLFCYLGVALAFGLTYVIFSRSSLNLSDHFYVPILLLIGFYTLVAVLKDKKQYEKRDPAQAFLKSAGKYVFWGLVIEAVRWFYNVHPSYYTFTPHTQVLLRDFFKAYVVGGWPYFFLEEMYRYCRDNVLPDPYVRVVLLLRSLVRGKFDHFRRLLFSRRNRRTILSWMIRLHYIPIMVEQVHYGLTNLQGYWTMRDVYRRDGGRLDFVAILVATLAWLIDSNNASVGYFWQSTFTKTRFRDADPHPSHWLLVLCCYPPFIDFVTRYFVPFPALPEDAARAFSNPNVNMIIDWAVLAALVCYMLSGCTLAFSYSNLCYKSIQTRGPYRFIRHPATTCKLMFFTLSFFRIAEAYDARWVVCYVFWIWVYIGRALIEERFLRRTPEYRAYMRKTKYRFFPGIV